MDEWEAVRRALALEGVAGFQDFGRFVGNTAFFPASELDERAAMPVLLRMLPSLTDAKLVASVAGHMHRPWARLAAFAALNDAYRRWARSDPSAGWALGDSMANAARIDDLPQLLDVAADRDYGRSRQMVVYALSRFRRCSDVEPVLIELLPDPDVAFHAMGALRRTLGAAAALPYLREVRTRHANDEVGKIASREIRKAEKTFRTTQLKRWVCPSNGA